MTRISYSVITFSDLFSSTFYVPVETCRQSFPLGPVVEDGDPDLVPGEDDVGPGAALAHSVAAPLGLEPVVLPLNGDEGAHAVHREGGRQVLEGHQQVQVPLSLQGVSQIKHKQL